MAVETEWAEAAENVNVFNQTVAILFARKKYQSNIFLISLSFFWKVSFEIDTDINVGVDDDVEVDVTGSR